MVEIGGVDGLITPLDVCFTLNTGRTWVHEFESVVDPERKLMTLDAYLNEHRSWKP